ncbi:hypothetical protein J7E68_14105, partial [Microbacterium sp. ISL-103]|nr:hypothetical protein [Microbacterium sp. ISL-103]
AQLDDAARSIPLLPKDARAAVRSAHALFGALTRRVAKTPAATLYERRVRVPDPVKALLAGRSVLVASLGRGRWAASWWSAPEWPASPWPDCSRGTVTM